MATGWNGRAFQVVMTANDPKALAEAWNGRAWQIQQAVAPPGATYNVLYAVSCVSASFCEAVGTHFDSAGNQVNLAEMWDGTSWTIQATPSPQSQFGPVADDLFGVSCVSASFCEAVGVGPAGPSAEVWNGTSWKVQARPGAAVQPQSVSCDTVDFCMSVDGFGRMDIWNGSSWSAGPSVTGFSAVTGVSCVSASFCAAVGGGPSGENAVVWNGSTWSAQPTPGPAGVALSAISCPTVNSCEAVGTLYGQGNPQTLAETWNGSTWTVQPTPNPSVSQGSSLSGVWCTSASSCTAVGQYQYSNLSLFHTLAEVWNGQAWSLRSTPDNRNAGQNLLSGVSCGASQACTAVGQTRDAGLIPATLIEAGD
jgi:hypothetical protein